MALERNLIDNSTKTVLGILNQFHGQLEAQYVVRPNTTQNYLFGVYPNETPSTVPRIAYFGIGIMGKYNITDKNLSEAYYPRMTDMGLYEPIPFRCVPVTEDLSTSERRNYRLRKRIERNGNSYYAYYLKKIDFSESVTSITRIDPVTKEEYPYELEEANLRPTPNKTKTDGVISPIASEINVSIKAKLSILGSEVIESIGVLKDGDMRYAVVSEYGIYTGEDRIVTGHDHANVPFDYTEAIYTQLASKTCTQGVPLNNASSFDNRTLVIGNGTMLTLE